MIMWKVWLGFLINLLLCIIIFRLLLVLFSIVRERIRLLGVWLRLKLKVKLLIWGKWFCWLVLLLVVILCFIRVNNLVVVMVIKFKLLLKLRVLVMLVLEILFVGLIILFFVLVIVLLGSCFGFLVLLVGIRIWLILFWILFLFFREIIIEELMVLAIVRLVLVVRLFKLVFCWWMAGCEFLR